MFTAKKRVRALWKLPPRPAAKVDRAGQYEIDEVCAHTRLCRAFVYREIKAGRLRIKKRGKRTFVHGRELLRYLAA
jgi:hypothetical protein